MRLHLRTPFTLSRILPAAVVFVIVTAAPALCDVNLGISDDETYKRPNSWGQNREESSPNQRLLAADFTGPASRPGVSIAWRNANQVEEVEVRVRNLGTDAGEGHVFVDVLDESGKILLHLEPPDNQKIVRVPAADRGGREGKIIRMNASWELNTLIDRFDRARTRYDVRATVETIGRDTDPFDNAKVKSWNIPFGVRPSTLNAYNYIFKNYEPSPVSVRWFFEHTPYPKGWEVKGVPESDKPFVLGPGQEVRGTLTMSAPGEIEEGAFLEARLSLVRSDNGTAFEQHEWFQVYDTKPPSISNYRAVLLDDHRIAIQVLVADQGSGVLEATGVQTEFSLDGGRTWASKAHNYKTGNFVKPTLFETVLGPFPPATNVQLRFTAMDTAGNIATTIPNDAVGFVAPPDARQLLEQAYLFPRNQPNPVFDLDRLKELRLNLDRLKSLNVDLATMDLTKPNALGIDPNRLKELKMDEARLNDLKVDLARVRDLNLDFNKVEMFSLKRINSPGEQILSMTTLEIQVK